MAKQSYESKFNICCQSSNLVYCLQCNTCDKQYVGQTKPKLLERLREHFNNIRKKHQNEPIGRHFNTAGHYSDIKQVTTYIQSTPVISRQLGAKIRERELRGSPVESAKAQTRDFPDQSPTLWHLHLLNPNSMLSDNGCTYISQISADVYIAPATNHNKPYYILIITHQKLSNYTLHKAAYDGICAETIQTMMRFDRKRK